MRRPSLIALLTDFGTRDHYAAVMKAVLLHLAPGSTVVDLSHGVGRYRIDEGALLLWSSYRYFPPRTVFVAVVDPGVGTRRRIVCLSAGGYTFLAPDNGILKFVAAGHPRARAVAIDVPKLRLRNVSDTFHGRDIFAPVAARLARGMRPDALGPRIRLAAEPMLDTRGAGSRGVAGRILAIDAFGNIITNVLAPAPARGWTARIGSRRVTAFARSYADQPQGRPFLLRGSSGLLEISMNKRSAARALRARSGQKVIVCRV